MPVTIAPALAQLKRVQAKVALQVQQALAVNISQLIEF